MNLLFTFSFTFSVNKIRLVVSEQISRKMTSPAEKVCPYEGNRSSSQLRPSMVWCVCDSVGCVRFSGMSEMEGYWRKSGMQCSLQVAIVVSRRPPIVA